MDEHRAEPVLVKVPGLGHAVLTRVAAADGRQFAEIRLRVALPDREPHARHSVKALLNRLPELIAGRRDAARSAA
jgi:hypothetical protein